MIIRQNELSRVSARELIFACTGILPFRHQGRSEPKRFAVGSQKPFSLQFSQFCGKSTAIHPQVIRQLLTVKRDQKSSAFMKKRLIGKVSKDTPPYRTVRRIKSTAG